MIQTLRIECDVIRTYSGQLPPYICTLDITNGELMATYPQTRAVMDDFGFLFFVAGWK